MNKDKTARARCNKMLVAKQAYLTMKYTSLALLEPEEKKRDFYVNKIIDCCEAMEKQYTTNWH